MEIKSTNKIGKLTYKGVALINAETAEDILKKQNINNRKINKNVVQAYADDMKNGYWQDLPGGLILTFNRKGQLIDGQHRLSAIVNNGFEVMMMIFEYDSEETAQMLAFDRGKARTLKDVTGYDKDIISILTFFSFFSGYTKKMTPFIFDRFYSGLSGEEKKFIEKLANFRKKGISSAVKSSFMFYYHSSSDRTETEQIWNCLKNKDYKNEKANRIRDFVLSSIGSRDEKDKIILFVNVLGILEGKTAKSIKREEFFTQKKNDVKNWVLPILRDEK